MTDLESILAGPHRSTAHKARDRYRHPKETLTFFGLQPDMNVVEVWPITGWYTEILAPYLRALSQGPSPRRVVFTPGVV